MPSRHHSTTRVLVVEDDPDAFDLLQLVVTLSHRKDQGAGALEVLRAATTVEALTMLRHGEPVDVVVLDLGLPDAPAHPKRLGALDLLRPLAGVPPIIVVTASLNSSEQEALALGAAAYLPKYTIISGDELWTTISDVIR